MSGTSFAAPLVSGAIALLQDRWPWLAKDPANSAYIILKSAKDLGAPGPDPVYGVGLLDVEASQSPLSYDSLRWYISKNGTITPTTAAALRDPRQQSTWDASSAYVYAFESLPHLGYRDFAVPLSSKLVGQTVLGPTGQTVQLQNYLTASFKTWAGAAFAASSKPRFGDGLMDFRSGGEAELGQFGDFGLTLQLSPVATEPGWRAAAMPVASHFSLANQGGSSVEFGYGQGGMRLNGVSGFSQASDYNPLKGGANPLLGLASGGAYGSVNYAIAPNLRLSAGVTRRNDEREQGSLPIRDWRVQDSVRHYQATAQRVGMTWRANNRLQISGGVTRLHEADGVLGEQSLQIGDLSEGSVTQAMDVGADLALGHGLTLSAQAVSGRTKTHGDQNLRTVGGGLRSTSFAFAAAKTGVLGHDDHVRLTVSQPLYVNRGKMSYSGVQVVDRQTGELGVVTQTFGVQQADRPIAAELLYGKPILKGAGAFGVFGRFDSRGADEAGNAAKVFMAGARASVSF
jgi:hypothetical protein